MNPSGEGRSRPRLAAVDRVRGLALAGIMIENAGFYAVGGDMSGGEAGVSGDASESGGNHGLLRAGLALTVEYRGLPLFCLLLGWGAAARLARGAPSADLRRLAVVWIGLGALNALIFFPGDILMAYGVLLLALLPWAVRGTVSRRTCAALAVLFALNCVVTAALLAWADDPVRFEQMSFAASTWLAGFQVRAVEAAAALLALPLVLTGLLLPAVLGFASWTAVDDRAQLGGTGLLSRPSALTLTVAGGLLCVPHAAGFLVQGPAAWSLVAEGAAAVGGFVQVWGFWHLVLAGAGADAPSSSAAAWTPRAAATALLEAAGRNSLSLYLVHAMTFSVIFSAWGLGLATASLPTMVFAASTVWFVLAVLAALTRVPWPAERLVRRVVPVRSPVPDRPMPLATAPANGSVAIPAPPGGTR